MREFSFDQPAGEILPPETKAPTDSALAIIETLSPDDIFTPGTLDPYLKAFSDAVLKDAAPYTDMTKAPHRDALRTLAAAVGKKKTAIETKRKALVADMVLRKARIDKEGGRLVEIVQGLQDIVRSPLTGWENMEKTRKANHERMTAQLVEWGKVPFGLSSSAIEAIIFQVEAVHPATLEEYAELAEGHKGRSLAVLQTALKQALDAEAQKAENDRLRAAEVERQSQERAINAARFAREQAERDAEAERRRLTTQAQQAEQRAAEAERRALQAVEEERKRADEAKAREQRSAAAREADKAHREAVHACIRDALALLGVPSITVANAIIAAIAKGDIPNVSITY
jgi:hypothetical protein